MEMGRAKKALNDFVSRWEVGEVGEKRTLEFFEGLLELRGRRARGR